ncbi:MAG TPA: hypothetical protein VJ768_06360 [Anaerolineales bacterium]|jgi:hypothetical protein|nr:hypothetical protein [Anaerolineales bacterium]
MNIGMLWYDNDPKKTLVDKVGQAATYYHEKYGKRPDLCFVHPSLAPGERERTGAVEIRSSGSVLPNYFWIGVNVPPDGD